MSARRQALQAGMAGAIVIVLYVSVFLPGAWFRFDDFHQLTGSAPPFVDVATVLTSPNEADGRWNPGMRVALRLIAGGAGLERAWPFYLALVAGHALNIFLAVRIGRALGAAPRARAITVFVAVAGVNFSMFTLVTIALLFSVLCTAWMLAAVLAAVRYARGGGWWYAAACGGCTLAALCFREIAIVTPLLCALVLSTSRGSWTAFPSRKWAGLGFAFFAAAAAFVMLASLAGVAIVPETGRYRLSIGWHTARHLAVLGAHVAAWLVVPLVLIGATAAGRFRHELVLAAGWAVISVLPTLLLTWQSPGHLYLALFGTALGAGPIWSAVDERTRLNALALPLVAVLMVAAAAGLAARREILRWGPITRQVLADWQALRRPGDGRVVIFDADNDAPYRGLARLIGPGIRLREALRLVSREPVSRATICIDLVEGPPYAPEAGDALFLHDDGRLQRVSAPPFSAYCLPSDPAVTPRD